MGWREWFKERLSHPFTGSQGRNIVMYTHPWSCILAPNYEDYRFVARNSFLFLYHKLRRIFLLINMKIIVLYLIS